MISLLGHNWRIESHTVDRLVLARINDAPAEVPARVAKLADALIDHSDGRPLTVWSVLDIMRELGDWPDVVDHQLPEPYRLHHPARARIAVRKLDPYTVAPITTESGRVASLAITTSRNVRRVTCTVVTS